MPVLEIKKPAAHTMLVATELTTEDMLEIFTVLAKKLTWQLEAAQKQAANWKSSFEMYTDDWEREVKPYGFLDTHKHHIDSMVITTRTAVHQAVQWRTQQRALENRDPFWNVPEPKAADVT